MSIEAKPFSEVVKDLAGNTPVLSAATVYGLSNLTRAQLGQLARQWQGFSLERRRTLVQHLNEVSESNFEMNFREVNHIALEDADSEVRQHAIEGLWEDESLPYMRKLIAMVQHDLSTDVRAAALVELGRFILLGEYQKITASDARSAQDAVLHILHSNEDPELRRRALESIANSSRAGIREHIEEFFAQDDLPQQMSALFAMGRTCDPHWAPQVMEALQSNVPELQFEAARAAGNMELSQSLSLLVDLLGETEDKEVAIIAIWALGEIGGDEARNVLDNIIARAEEEAEEEILEAAQDALDAASLSGDMMMFDFEP